MGRTAGVGTIDEVSRRTIRGVPDDDLWELRSASRRQLVGMRARTRLARQLAASRGDRRRSEPGAAPVFDPNVLTLGFARRFATYKRPNLLLHDPDAARSAS